MGDDTFEDRCNLLKRAKAEAKYHLLKEHGIPVWVMEPEKRPAAAMIGM